MRNGPPSSGRFKFWTGAAGATAAPDEENGNERARTIAAETLASVHELMHADYRPL